MSEEPNSDNRDSQKQLKDRKIKRIFLGAILVVVAIIVLYQRQEPELKGWETDLQATLDEAAGAEAKVFVFFTSRPMSYNDKKMLDESLKLRDVAKALRMLRYPKVHLDTKTHKALAEKYKIEETPTLLLLNGDGSVVKSHVGFMAALSVANDFLGVQVKGAP